MFFTTVIGTALVSIASCQYQMAYPDSNAPTQASVQKSTYPGAPLHYVQIGPQLAGDYKFGYDTGKGPLGQSFREEIRLADGTISGTYGVVDELGHRRVVHYSAGKQSLTAQKDRSSRLVAETISSPSSATQNRYAENQNSNAVPQPSRYTSPLARLVNQLQPKVVTPLYKQAESIIQQRGIVTPPRAIAVPERTIVSPQRATASSQRTMATPQSSGYGLPVPPTERLDETTRSLLEYYQASNVHRMDKFNAHAREQEIETKNDKPVMAKVYDPKIEDEYYDSAPAFIDIGRLSYNIGTDKNADVKF